MHPIHGANLIIHISPFALLGPSRSQRRTSADVPVANGQLQIMLPRLLMATVIHIHNRHTLD